MSEIPNNLDFVVAWDFGGPDWTAIRGVFYGAGGRKPCFLNSAIEHGCPFPRSSTLGKVWGRDRGFEVLKLLGTVGGSSRA